MVIYREHLEAALRQAIESKKDPENKLFGEGNRSGHVQVWEIALLALKRGEQIEVRD
mgnify:FL=1